MCFFVIDIIIGMITSFKTKNNIIETSKKKVLIHYLKTWFIIDIFSVVPFNFFQSQIGGAGKLMKMFKF